MYSVCNSNNINTKKKKKDFGWMEKVVPSIFMKEII